jgi:prepilin-type N-terminal cleavage/methylation domain-containing protein
MFSLIRKRMKGEKGFTLIEVVIAVAILAITGIGFVGSMGLAPKVLLRTDLQETGKDLAQAVLVAVDCHEQRPASHPVLECLSGGDAQKVYGGLKKMSKLLHSKVAIRAMAYALIRM